MFCVNMAVFEDISLSLKEPYRCMLPSNVELIPNWKFYKWNRSFKSWSTHCHGHIFSFVHTSDGSIFSSESTMRGTYICVCFRHAVLMEVGSCEHAVSHTRWIAVVVTFECSVTNASVILTTNLQTLQSLVKVLAGWTLDKETISKIMEANMRIF